MNSLLCFSYVETGDLPGEDSGKTSIGLIAAVGDCMMYPPALVGTQAVAGWPATRGGPVAEAGDIILD